MYILLQRGIRIYYDVFDPGKNENRPQDVREPDAYQDNERRYRWKEANEHIRNGEVSNKQKQPSCQFTF